MDVTVHAPHPSRVKPYWTLRVKLIFANQEVWCVSPPPQLAEHWRSRSSKTARGCRKQPSSCWRSSRTCVVFWGKLGWAWIQRRTVITLTRLRLWRCYCIPFCVCLNCKLVSKIGFIRVCHVPPRTLCRLQASPTFFTLKMTNCRTIDPKAAPADLQVRCWVSKCRPKDVTRYTLIPFVVLLRCNWARRSVAKHITLQSLQGNRFGSSTFDIVFFSVST